MADLFLLRPTDVLHLLPFFILHSSINRWGWDENRKSGGGFRRSSFKSTRHPIKSLEMIVLYMRETHHELFSAVCTFSCTAASENISTKCWLSFNFMLTWLYVTRGIGRQRNTVLLQKSTMGHSHIFSRRVSATGQTSFVKTQYSSRTRRVANQHFVGSSRSTKRLVAQNDFGPTL